MFDLIEQPVDEPELTKAEKLSIQQLREDENFRDEILSERARQLMHNQDAVTNALLVLVNDGEFALKLADAIMAGGEWERVRIGFIRCAIQAELKRMARKDYEYEKRIVA